MPLKPRPADQPVNPGDYYGAGRRVPTQSRTCSWRVAFAFAFAVAFAIAGCAVAAGYMAAPFATPFAVPYIGHGLCEQQPENMAKDMVEDTVKDMVKNLPASGSWHASFHLCSVPLLRECTLVNLGQSAERVNQFDWLDEIHDDLYALDDLRTAIGSVDDNTTQALSDASLDALAHDHAQYFDDFARLAHGISVHLQTAASPPHVDRAAQSRATLCVLHSANHELLWARRARVHDAYDNASALHGHSLRIADIAQDMLKVPAYTSASGAPSTLMALPELLPDRAPANASHLLLALDRWSQRLANASTALRDAVGGYAMPFAELRMYNLAQLKQLNCSGWEARSKLEPEGNADLETVAYMSAVAVQGAGDPRAQLGFLRELVERKLGRMQLDAQGRQLCSLAMATLLTSGCWESV